MLLIASANVPTGLIQSGSEIISVSVHDGFNTAERSVAVPVVPMYVHQSVKNAENRVSSTTLVGPVYGPI